MFVLRPSRVPGFSCSVIGRQWVALWVDGASAAVSFESVPRNLWVHLHFSGLSRFDGRLVVMGEAGLEPGDGCLKGRLSEAYVWGRSLNAAEIAVVADGFDFTLIYNREYANLWAAFIMEEGSGASLSKFVAWYYHVLWSNSF